LTDLQHPNLVQLGELFEDDGRWFFTMELLDGEDFLSYVRGGGATPPLGSSPANDVSPGMPCDLSRLRTGLEQLVSSVLALHRAGKVHRDIKPSNVHVTTEGRVVLLDFGLVTNSEGRQTTEALAVGTAAYMAPEQATGVPVGPAADWYSVGAVLYEALTGRLPFTGTAFEMLLSKQSAEATPPRLLMPELPVDLSDLCMALLKPDPASRMVGDELLRRVSGGRSPEIDTARSRPITAFTRGAPFVGRQEEQQRLLALFQQVTRTGAMAAAYVHGESGVGKTALVKELTQHIDALHDRTVVLRGRCYERETVPYKAFDGVVDSLTRFLRGLSEGQCAALLPRRAQALPMVFPVLGRIKALTMHAGPRFSDTDRATLRAHALSALREMFERIAEQRRLIIVIDDLQWADAESLALLLELSRPPDAPGLLLIVTARDPEECPPEVCSAIERTLEQVSASARIRLAGLPVEDAARLAEALLEGGETQVSVEPSQLAREAQGHPLFIDALVRYSQQVRLTAGARPELDDALRFRIGQLEPEARRLLELISLAAAPLAHKVVADAAGRSMSEVAAEVAKLRIVKLVRTSRSRQLDTVETFHDRIRHATVSRLSPADRARQHRRLAEALEAHELMDVEAAAFHFREAGVPEKAALFALRAADRAMENLAFDKAARLYREVIELDPHASTEIKIKLADALSNAGRARDAADAYLAALETAPAALTLELRRRAAQQLLGCGEVDVGMAVASDLLTMLGVKLPSSQAGALLSLLYQRFKLRLRGLGFRERDCTEVPEEQLARVDTLWAMAALGMVDHIRGTDLQTRHVLWALETGDPYRISRALSMEAWLRASSGGARTESSSEIVAVPMELAERCQHPHALALAHLAAGIQAYNRGLLREVRSRTDLAETLLRERCTGVAWEITNARLFGGLASMFLGDFEDLKHRVPSALREAEERGDAFARTNLATALGYVLDVARGDPEAGLARVDEAMAAWSQRGFYLQQFLALMARTQCLMAAERVEEAVLGLERAWPSLEKSELLRAQSAGLFIRWLRARCLAALAKKDSRQLGRLRAALADARWVAKVPSVLAPGLAGNMRAAIAHARGQDEEALALLEQTALVFDEHHIQLGVLAVRSAIARVKGGDEGSQVQASVLAECRRRGIEQPQFVLRIYWPF
jgi:tetratricopeptide (TPR) repeat protein